MTDHGLAQSKPRSPGRSRATMVTLCFGDSTQAVARPVIPDPMIPISILMAHVLQRTPRGSLGKIAASHSRASGSRISHLAVYVAVVSPAQLPFRARVGNMARAEVFPLTPKVSCAANEKGDWIEFCLLSTDAKPSPPRPRKTLIGIYVPRLPRSTIFFCLRSFIVSPERNQ